MDDRSLAGVAAGVLARMPMWVRRDLGAADPNVRQRAEETLAASIAAALSGAFALPA